MSIAASLVSAMSPTETEVVRQCLKAAFEGGFFPDWEFQTLIGVDRTTVKLVYETWPNVMVSEDALICSVLGSMHNLLRYPHGLDEELAQRVPYASKSRPLSTE